jgi:cell shape-determining protein MreD
LFPRQQTEISIVIEYLIDKLLQVVELAFEKLIALVVMLIYSETITFVRRFMVGLHVEDEEEVTWRR